jgi:hypothetical protein
MFMAAATLMWWPVMSPVAELPRLPEGPGMLYLFLVGIPMQLVAALITTADEVLYPWYAAAPRTWGLSPLDDQRRVRSDRAELLLPPEHRRLLRRRQDREHDAHVRALRLGGRRRRRRRRSRGRDSVVGHGNNRERHREQDHGECGQSRARHSPPPPPPAFASAESGAAGTGRPGGYLPHGVAT